MFPVVLCQERGLGVRVDHGTDAALVRGLRDVAVRRRSRHAEVDCRADADGAVVVHVVRKGTAPPAPPVQTMLVSCASRRSGAAGVPLLVAKLWMSRRGPAASPRRRSCSLCPRSIARDRLAPDCRSGSASRWSTGRRLTSTRGRRRPCRRCTCCSGGGSLLRFGPGVRRRGGTSVLVTQPEYGKLAPP